MQYVAESTRNRSAMPGLERVRHFLTSSLDRRWFVQIEHADEVLQHGPQWQSWNTCHVTPKDPQDLINDILACHHRYPQHSIRLSAQRSQPETRMVYWVDLDDGNPDEAERGNSGKVLSFRQKANA